jgi:DNA polymerase
MRDFYIDLETRSPVPIKDGSYRYAERAEVTLWAYALEGDAVKVWDLLNDRLHWQEDLSGVWTSAPLRKGQPPVDLEQGIRDSGNLVWAHNGGQFDFPVIDRALPILSGLITHSRRRDTMVQAFAHALPGSLDKLGSILDVDQGERKLSEGRKWVRLFCIPKEDGTYNTKQSHPKEWQHFIEYAGQDIVTMRSARRRMPEWNYKGKQVDLCLLDWKINGRGFAVDVDLAQAAVRASDKEKAELARQTREATNDAVQAATQRDELLKHILAEYGVTLPDMQSDTLERRLEDPDLPEGVKDLIRIRLQASRNTAAKFKALLKSVSHDHRLRGCAQFRGAGRTGRWAHRRFQPGNLMRPTLSHAQIELAIEALKTDCADLIFPDVMEAIGNTVRGAIVAGPGKKLVIADLSNIEGRGAAWAAGEEWKLQAFRDFDNGIGHDLYIVAYAKSFGVAPETVPKKGPERQIGKVEELMFQYGGGVGAWITGAATYGIDLDKMTAQVWDTLPAWAIEEAEGFLQWLYDIEEAKVEKARVKYGDDSPQHLAAEERLPAAKIKARFGLAEQVFQACDAIKRLWRRAHPQISSYWKELEDTACEAIDAPGETFPCRKVKIRRDGAWLRIGLPSGRALCYPNPQIEKDGSITYTGQNTYTRQWGRVHTYGGKLFENLVQALACDQLAECMPLAEAAGYPIVLHVHDELICETPDEPQFTAEELGRIMCSDLGWNAGLPLAAAGFETKRYEKG